MESGEDVEDTIRFIWNTTASSKVEQARCSIHPAFHYTPLGGENTVSIEYQPLMCTCEAVLNRYCPIDFNLKTVRCCFCQSVIPLPSNYAKAISPKKLPFELSPEYCSLEFKHEVKAQPAQKQPLPLSSQNCLLFVVDLCISEKELNSIKASLVSVLEGMPTDGSCFVGLITFYKHVNVYELASKINTNYCINGSKDYNLMDIMNILGIQNVRSDPQGKTYEVFRRFITQVNSPQDVNKLVRRVKDIKRDQTITVNQRNARATGQALNIAISLA